MDPLKNIVTLKKEDYPFLLKQLARLPETMEMIGAMPPETHKYLCVVGSRAYSSYGKDVCEKLIAGLAGYPIVIVSGLAIGIDSIAHEAALKAGLKTIAFPGSGLGLYTIYPQTHIGLARRIVEAGGTLLSPFPRNMTGVYWAFPTRNKLMAGISSATLVIEAEEKSGSLITANDTSKISRDLLVVPGSIFSPTSQGSNELLRNGGIAVTSSEEILEVLGLGDKAPGIEPSKGRSLFERSDSVASSADLVKGPIPGAFMTFNTILSPDEKLILEKLAVPIQRDDLIRELNLPAGFVNAVLIELELKGVIAERQGLLMVN